MPVTTPTDELSPTVTTNHDEPDQLSWRIPVDDPSRSFRAALLPLLFFSVVLAAIFLLFSPPEVRGLRLLATLPLTVMLLYFYWRSQRRANRAAGDNVVIDRDGVHWLDDFRRRHSFLREQIIGFRIALDADTQRPVPALTLQLKDGFETQPIEMYAPATPAAVRRTMTNSLRLSEQAFDSEPFTTSLGNALTAMLNDWPPTPTKRLLKRSLCQPTPHQAGRNDSWLVCEIAGLAQITYEPVDCCFRWLPTHNGPSLAVANLEELLQHVDQNRPPTDAQIATSLQTQIDWRDLDHFDDRHRDALATFLVQQLGPELTGPPSQVEFNFTCFRQFDVEVEGSIRDAQQTWNVEGEASWDDDTSQYDGYVELTSEQAQRAEQEQLARDARQVGFTSHIDREQQVWHFEGSRSALLALCNQIEEAAESLRTAPLGAKPQERRIGGQAMYVTIQTAEHAWISLNTLCGPPSKLRELAETLRSTLEATEIDSSAVVPVSWGGNERWAFLLQVRPEGFKASLE